MTNTETIEPLVSANTFFREFLDIGFEECCQRIIDFDFPEGCWLVIMESVGYGLINAELFHTDHRPKFAKTFGHLYNTQAKRQFLYSDFTFFPIRDRAVGDKVPRGSEFVGYEFKAHIKEERENFVLLVKSLLI